MTKEIKETTEVYRKFIRKQYMDGFTPDIILDVLKICQAVESAEGKLEKREIHNCLNKYVRESNEIYNQAISIATPILAKAKLRIEELEEMIKTGKCQHIAEDVISGECSLCHLAWCELRIKVLEKKIDDMKVEWITLKDKFRDKTEELQSLKDFYNIRFNTLQEAQKEFREPERTIVCNILANGKPKI